MPDWFPNAMWVILTAFIAGIGILILFGLLMLTAKKMIDK